VIYLLAFVVVSLAAARLTRVFNIDEIAAPLRTWIIGRYGEHSKPGKIVACYWCAGFWIAALCTTYAQVAICASGYAHWYTLAGLPLTIPAVAYSASWILDREEAGNGI
jgi:hypothetical protein